MSRLGACRSRWAFTSAATLALGACSTGATVMEGPDGAAISRTRGENVFRSEAAPAITTTPLEVAPDSVFRAVTRRLDGLGIDMRTDPTNRVAVLAEARQRRRIGSASASRYLDCGLGRTGMNADSYLLQVDLGVEVTPLPGNGSQLQIRIAAVATPSEGTSSGQVACRSTGRLEQALLEAVPGQGDDIEASVTAVGAGDSTTHTGTAEAEPRPARASYRPVRIGLYGGVVPEVDGSSYGTGIPMMGASGEVNVFPGVSVGLGVTALQVDDTCEGELRAEAGCSNVMFGAEGLIRAYPLTAWLGMVGPFVGAGVGGFGDEDLGTGQSFLMAGADLPIGERFQVRIEGQRRHFHHADYSFNAALLGFQFRVGR